MLYAPEMVPVVRVIETETGETLGTTVINFQAEEGLPLAVASGPQGGLRLLAIDAAGVQITEYDLEVTDLPDLPKVGGSDSGQDVDGGGSASDGTQASCGCRQSGRMPAGGAAALAGLLGVGVDSAAAAAAGPRLRNGQGCPRLLASRRTRRTNEG